MPLEMFKHRLTQNTPHIVNLDQKKGKSSFYRSWSFWKVGSESPWESWAGSHVPTEFCLGATTPSPRVYFAHVFDIFITPPSFYTFIELVLCKSSDMCVRQFANVSKYLLSSRQIVKKLMTTIVLLDMYDMSFAQILQLVHHDKAKL